jgi:Domain of unknown function (DUF4780)
VALVTKVGTIQRLTWEEVVNIKEALLGKLDEYEPIPGSAVGRPCFLGTRTWQGLLEIQCQDALSFEWLKSCIGTIQVNNFALRVFSKSDMPKTLKAQFFVPGQPVEDVHLLKRIEKQNAGLVTSGWRITFSSEQTEKGRFVIIAIDERSADVIKNQNSGIFYRLQRLQVTLKPQSTEIQN